MNNLSQLNLFPCPILNSIDLMFYIKETMNTCLLLIFLCCQGQNKHQKGFLIHYSTTALSVCQLFFNVPPDCNS